MKLLKKRLIFLGCIFMLLFLAAACAANAPEASDSPAPADFGILSEIAGENGATYANLFDVILDNQYDDYWVEKCASIVGDDAAAESAAFLKS